MKNLLSRGSRRTRAAVGALALAIPIAVVASSSASAGVNLVVNPGLEQSSSGFPACFSKVGNGTSTWRTYATKKAHSGSTAVAVSISKHKSGERLAMITESASCAPHVIPGRQYNLGLWYMSTTPNTVIELYRHDATKGWVFWEDLKNLPATGTYKNASARTPVIPAGTNQIAFGAALYGNGTLITDDYSMSDATVTATATVCSGGKACTMGAWQVLPFKSPVRSIHATVLYNGNILFVAGSGNDPNAFQAGSFESAVYNPNTGKFQVIPTPDDFFCAGHVQLPNGDVLVVGGNKAYPAAANGTTAAHGYEGLNTSYIFDPVTLKYYKVNNLIVGHWYPSATELGNGDVISYGGLDGAGVGATVIEYFKYGQPITESAPVIPTNGAEGNWLAENQINQSFGGWGMYPAMILTQNGQLFYSGSHVFGNNQTPVGDNGGVDPNGAGEGNGGAGFLNIANILNPAGADPVVQVNGLQDNPGGPAGTDMTDQSMSVLLPPAQAQRVFLAGRGNILYQKPATRDTDLINLNASDPKYVHGPLLPRGTLSNGKVEPANEGKMYVSMVLMPNGQVFETGGGLTDRENPVYEAAMINPVKLEQTPTNSNDYTAMATDPVWRGYHSESLLLPDGRVLSVGNNPGDGTFNMQMSVYSPPYLFHGARPAVTSVQSTNGWRYGGNYKITTNGPITSAELIRPESVTHQSDPNQRFVALTISGTGTKLSVNVPTNPNLTPPGWYMLFVDNANGVPSVAKWVHVG